MKANKQTKSAKPAKIKAQIIAFRNGVMECKHIASSYKFEAINPKNIDIEIGQVVLLEYVGNNYIVDDGLIEIVNSRVLNAQHIIDNNKMYTSLILENPKTKQRMHSLIPSTNSIFYTTCVILTGDLIRIKINNGNLFSVEYEDGERNGDNTN